MRLGSAEPACCLLGVCSSFEARLKFNAVLFVFHPSLVEIKKSNVPRSSYHSLSYCLHDPISAHGLFVPSHLFLSLSSLSPSLPLSLSLPVSVARLLWPFARRTGGARGGWTIQLLRMIARLSGSIRWPRNDRPTARAPWSALLANHQCAWCHPHSANRFRASLLH